MLLANETVADSSRERRRARAVPRPRGAGPAEGRAVRGVHLRVRLLARRAAQRAAAAALPAAARADPRHARGAADRLPDAADDAEGALRAGEPRALRPGGVELHALHLADPPLSRTWSCTALLRAHRRGGDRRDAARGARRGPARDRAAHLRDASAAPTTPSGSCCSGRRCGSWPTRSATSSTATSPASRRSACSSSWSSTSSKGWCTSRRMADDYYRFVESSHTLRGENTQKVYRLGDKVRVQVDSRGHGAAADRSRAGRDPRRASARARSGAGRDAARRGRRPSSGGRRASRGRASASARRKKAVRRAGSEVSSAR